MCGACVYNRMWNVCKIFSFNLIIYILHLMVWLIMFDFKCIIYIIQIFIYYFGVLISHCAEGPGREILQRPLSIRLSVMFSFRTVTRKHIDVFLETLQVCAPCHGGVLHSFWYWWNVLWIFNEFFKYWKK